MSNKYIYIYMYTSQICAHQFLNLCTWCAHQVQRRWSVFKVELTTFCYYQSTVEKGRHNQ